MVKLRALVMVAIGCICVIAPAGAQARGKWATTREVLRLGSWRLDIARNPFSGGVACRLAARDHRAFYRSGAVGFRFNPHWNVAQAVYRLDGGAPVALRDELPTLIAQGVPIDRGGLDNAWGGIVWVPLERLRSGTVIAIEPRPDQRPVTLHFRGLVALHDLAIERGCLPESSFVE